MDEENSPPEGVGGGYSAPDQPVYTEEQRAMIMAAMIEELGIARKDTLPLEDGERKGRLRDPHLISQAPAPRKARRYSAGTEDKINGWKSFTPGDLTEEDMQLSSIADGQLARLRRGGGTGTTSDRGRGVTSIRGGHSQNTDRGRGQANRGGRGSGNVEQQMGRSSSVNVSVPTPQTYFNDERKHTPHMAHLAVKYPSAIDSAIARLRSGPLAKPSAPQQSSPTPGRKDSSSVRPNPTVVLPAKTKSHWGSNPLDPNVFLNAMGFGSNTSRETPTTSIASTGNISSNDPSLITKQSTPPGAVASPIRVTSSFEQSLGDQESPQTIAAATTGSVGPLPNTISAPSPGVGSSNQTNSRSTAQGISTKPVLPSLARSVPLENAATALKKPVGIMGSRWAPQPAVPFVSSQKDTSTPQAVTSLPLERKTANQIYRDHVVKIQKGESQSKPGQARLLRYTASDAKITLELLQNENLILREIIDKKVVVTHIAGATSITFQAAVRGKENCPIWTITFQVPFQAKKFHDLIEDHKNGQPTFGASVHQQRPSITASNGKEKPGTARSSSTAPEGSGTLSTISADPQAVLIQLETEAEDSTSQTTAPQNNLVNHAFNFGGLMEQEPIDLQQFSLPSVISLQDNGGFDTCIGTQPLNDPTGFTSVAPLISFAGEDDDESPMDERASAAHDLNLLFDNEMSMSTLNYLDKSPHGSLLVQLSRVVVRKGGIAATGLTGQELLSCPLYMDAAINLVGNFLSGSETFSRLPDHESKRLMKQQTIKVLELAVAAREGSIMTPSTSHIEVAPTFQLAIMPAINLPKPTITDKPRENKLAGPLAWSSLLDRIKLGKSVNTESTSSIQGPKQVSTIKHVVQDGVTVSPPPGNMHLQHSSIDELTDTFSGFGFTDVVQRPAPLAVQKSSGASAAKPSRMQPGMSYMLELEPSKLTSPEIPPSSCQSPEIARQSSPSVAVSSSPTSAIVDKRMAMPDGMPVVALMSRRASVDDISFGDLTACFQQSPISGPVLSRNVPTQDRPEATAKRSPVAQELSQIHLPEPYTNLFKASHGNLKGLPGLNQSVWCPTSAADQLDPSFPTRTDIRHRNNGYAPEGSAPQPKPNIAIPGPFIQGQRERNTPSGRTALSPVRRENVQTEVQKQTSQPYRY